MKTTTNRNIHQVMTSSSTINYSITSTQAKVTMIINTKSNTHKMSGEEKNT